MKLITSITFMFLATTLYAQDEAAQNMHGRVSFAEDSGLIKGTSDEDVDSGMVQASKPAPSEYMVAGAYGVNQQKRCAEDGASDDSPGRISNEDEPHNGKRRKHRSEQVKVTPEERSS